MRVLIQVVCCHLAILRIPRDLGLVVQSELAFPTITKERGNLCIGNVVLHRTVYQHVWASFFWAIMKLLENWFYLNCK